MTEPAKSDIGNLHVVDWYLWQAERYYNKRTATIGYRTRPQSDLDFNPETEPAKDKNHAHIV